RRNSNISCRFRVRFIYPKSDAHFARESWMKMAANAAPNRFLSMGEISDRMLEFVIGNPEIITDRLVYRPESLRSYFSEHGFREISDINCPFLSPIRQSFG